MTGPALSVWTKEDWFDPAWKTKDGKDDCYNVVAIQKARTERGRNRFQQIEQGIIPTRELAARFLGVTGQALTLWTKEDWFDPGWKTKVGKDDCYNILAIRKAQAAEGRKGSPQSDLSQQIRNDTNQEKLDIIRMQREERQIQLDERRGNILPRDEYTIAIRESIVVARDHLMALPKLLARLVPVKARKRFLKEADRIVEIGV